MSISRRRRTSAVALIASWLLVTAFPAGPADAAEGDSVTFRLGITQKVRPPELSPFRVTSSAGYGLIADMYDLLVEFGEDLSPAPGLAESWDVSEDGLTWTYAIREGATWQDGQPVSAEDVRFTYQYIIDSHDPAYTGPAAPDGNDTDADGEADNVLSLFDNYLDLDGGFEALRIEEIAAPDAQTLTIRTSEPIATLAQIFIPILPKHVWDGRTFAEAKQPLAPEDILGSGPYRVVDFQPDSVIRLEAYEGYWGGRPHIDELIYQYFENDEAMVNALRAGDIDFIDSVPPTLAPALEGDPNITVNRASTSDFAELGFNSWAPTPERFEEEGCADCEKGPTTGSLGDPWLTRPDVRAAMAGLLDKQHLVEFALSGFGAPGVSIVSPLSSTFHYAAPADDPLVFPAYSDEAGRAAARAAAEQRFRDQMAAIGFTDTDGNGILNVPDTAEAQAFDPQGAGGDWSLRLFVRDDDAEDQLAGDLMSGWFAAAGVDVDLERVPENPALYDATYPSASNADYDMYLWGWGPDPDPDFILSVFACDQINGWQDANYCDPEYDDLYRSSRSAIDPAERADIIRRLQDKVFHEAPYAVLWYTDTVEAYRSDRWEGFNPMPRSGGSLWSTLGLGPWGSRISAGPIGAAGPTPAPSLMPSQAPPSDGAPSDQPSGEPSASASAGASPSGEASPGPTGQPASSPTVGPSGLSSAAPPAGSSVRPSATPSTAPGGGTGGGTDTGMVLAGVAAIAAVGAVAFIFLRRRRNDDDDEE